MRDFFPPIKPYRRGWLRASSIHTLHFEECGNPKGRPLVFLHGGPGAAISPVHRRFFNPRKWRVVLFDQRGCGRSRPHAEIRENTTWDLVADIEKLREHLGIKKWVVFGGSWGSTLALAYGETHPERCKALVLRGIFLARRKQLDWFYRKGANYLFPDFWEEFVKPIPPRERGDMLAAYYKRLTSRDRAVRARAARMWMMWEGATLELRPHPAYMREALKKRYADSYARIECHYMRNRCFFKTDGQLLTNARRIRHIPSVIVHGRYDVICPLIDAWDLHKALPKSKLVVVPEAAHVATEPGIRSALIAETDRLASL